MPEAPEPGKVRRGLAFSLLGAVVAAMVVAVVLGKREAVAPAQAPKGSAPLPHVVTASGKVEPFRQIKISPEVSGEVIEILVTEGQAVKQGDALMRIKPDYYLANRDQAEGAFKSALANLEIADTHLQTARAELRRNQDLSQSKLVSASAFEEAQAAYTVALAQRRSAEGQVLTARAGLAHAQYDVDKTTLVSPINGTVAKLNCAVGERAIGTATTAGTEVMSIADLSAMEARVTVGERDIGSIDQGQKARLELNAFPGHTFEGTVLKVATSPERLGVPAESNDGRAVAFEVRIRLQNQQTFRPGMSVIARIQGPPGTTEPAPTASTKTPGHPWTS